MGFNNPMMAVDRAVPIVGLAGSEACAAFMAGRTIARKAASDSAGGKGDPRGRWMSEVARALACSSPVTWTDAPGKDSVPQIGGVTVGRVTRRPMLVSGSITGYVWDVSDQVREVQYNGSRRFASVAAAKAGIEAVLATSAEGTE